MVRCGLWCVGCADSISRGVAAAALIVALRQQVGRAAAGHAPWREDAQAILNERFAEGEIDEAEFTSRRAVLNGRD